jgi:hypothetical protein
MLSGIFRETATSANRPSATASFIARLKPHFPDIPGRADKQFLLEAKLLNLSKLSRIFS